MTKISKLKKIVQPSIIAALASILQANIGFADDSYCKHILPRKIHEIYTSSNIDAYDPRKKVEKRLYRLVERIIEDGLPSARCHARQRVLFPGSGYGSGFVEVFIANGSICVNEDDEYYDIRSADKDTFPWSERWPGAYNEAPARAVVFKPACYDKNGTFTGYKK